MAKFNPTDFVVSKAKPLPIIMLLDASGSMNEVLEGDSVSKIDVLNKSVKTMLKTLAKEESQASEFLVSAISFGGNPDGSDVKFVAELENAASVQYEDLKPYWRTPLGAALKKAKTMVEDKEKIPGRSYRPLVVLVCDGEPNDEWRGPLEDFIGSGRSAKCDRMALAVGCSKGSAAWSVLEDFVAGTENPVIPAEQAADIVQFFKFVTMSVTQRNRSEDPNKVLPIKNVLLLESGEEALAKAGVAEDAAGDVLIAEVIDVEPDEDEEQGFRFNRWARR